MRTCEVMEKHSEFNLWTWHTTMLIAELSCKAFADPETPSEHWKAWQVTHEEKQAQSPHTKLQCKVTIQSRPKVAIQSRHTQVTFEGKQAKSPNLGRSASRMASSIEKRHACLTDSKLYSEIQGKKVESMPSLKLAGIECETFNISTWHNTHSQQP